MKYLTKKNVVIVLGALAMIAAALGRDDIAAALAALTAP